MAYNSSLSCTSIYVLVSNVLYYLQSRPLLGVTSDYLAPVDNVTKVLLSSFLTTTR